MFAILVSFAALSEGCQDGSNAKILFPCSSQLNKNHPACKLSMWRQNCKKSCGLCDTKTTSEETAPDEVEETTPETTTEDNNTSEDCSGIDMTDDVIDEAIANTGACRVVEVMKAVQDATLCNIAQTNVMGAARVLYQKGMNIAAICDIVSDILQLGVLFNAEQCAMFHDSIMRPVMEGETMSLQDIENTIETQLDGIATAAVKGAEESVNTFNQFIEKINVCPTLNVNPIVWRERFRDVFQMIAAIKKLSDMGPEVLERFANTVAGDCKTYSVIFSVEIGALALLGVEQGIYVTWRNGDGVQEVGLVNGVSAGYNVDPDLDISIGFTVDILIGDKSVWGEWGYTLDVGASVPIFGVGAGVTMGLVFGADSETKALGNFLGFTMGLDFSLGESSTTVDFDLSVSCGYAAANSFTERMGECRPQAASAVDDLLASLEETKAVFNGKIDEMKRCGQMYACEAKQCAYNFHGHNYRECQTLAGQCSEGMEICTKWEYTCKKTTYLESNGDCLENECREKTSKECEKYMVLGFIAVNKCKDVTETVCDGICLVYQKIFTPVVNTFTSAAKCVGDAVIEVAEKTRCLEYLPYCTQSVNCYISRSVVSATDCVNGMVMPGEECLEENGFI